MPPAGPPARQGEQKNAIRYLKFADICSRGQRGLHMARAKRASKRTAHGSTLSVMGTAGVSLAMAGGASATAPADAPPQDTAPRPAVFLGEEEMADVSLATFYVFDKNYVQAGEILRVARGGCGGCSGCAARGCAARGFGGCAARGCAARGCARACAGCRGCRGCAIRGCGGCGCVACGGGCGSCWRVWTPLGWIWSC